MTALIVISIITIVFSVPMLLWLSSIEHKKFDGYARLNLMGAMMSVVFGVIPFVNLFIIFCFIMTIGSDVVLWTNKK